MALRSTSALVLLTSIITRTGAVRNCWFPDGNTETPDIPCNPSADESACCNENAFCLSNGLCLSSGVVSRGSCTDRSWNDPACAQQCTNENTDMGLSLINCDATLGTWICATNGNSCDNDAVVFPIDTHDMNQITLRPQNNNDPWLVLEPSSTINNSSSSGNGSSVITTVTVTPSSSSSSGSGFTSGQMAGVGAGVGVPLLLCLLGAIFVITRQRKRLRAAEAYGKENELKPTNHNQGHFQQDQQPQQPGGYGQPMPYGNYGPEQKMQNSAAYYRPISPSPPAGHFREVEPVSEMDGSRSRQELDVPK